MIFINNMCQRAVTGGLQRKTDLLPTDKDKEKNHGSGSFELMDDEDGNFNNSNSNNHNVNIHHGGGNSKLSNTYGNRTNVRIQGPGGDENDQKKKKRRKSAGDTLTLLSSTTLPVPNGILSTYLVDKNHNNGQSGICNNEGISLKRLRALNALRSNINFSLFLQNYDEKEISNNNNNNNHNHSNSNNSHSNESIVLKDKKADSLKAVLKALQQHATIHPLPSIDSNTENELSEIKEKNKIPKVSNKKKEKDKEKEKEKEKDKGKEKEKEREKGEYSLNYEESPILSGVPLLTPHVMSTMANIIPMKSSSHNNDVNKNVHLGINMNMTKNTNLDMNNHNMMNDINYFPTNNSMSLPHLFLSSSSSPSTLSSINNQNRNATFNSNTSIVSKSVPIPTSIFTVPARNYGSNSSGIYNNSSHNDIDKATPKDNYSNNNNNNNNNFNNNNNVNNNDKNNKSISYDGNNNSYNLLNGDASSGYSERNATGNDVNNRSNNINELQIKSNSSTTGCIDSNFSDYKDTKINSAPTGHVVSFSSNSHIYSTDANSAYRGTNLTHLAPMCDESVHHQRDHLTNINLNQSVIVSNTRINIDSHTISSTVAKIEKGNDQIVSKEQEREQEHIDDKDGLLALEGLLSLSKY